MTLSPSAARAETGHGRLMPALDHPSDALRHFGPNWFASVMGTEIVANAAVTLPFRVTGLRTFALVVWLLASAMLVCLIAATTAHWIRHPAHARAHVRHPVMGQFYGAPPMAVMVVGAGAVLVGRDLIGVRAAVDLDWVLWFAGAASGLASAVIVPYFAFTVHRNRPDSVNGAWLMPVVPPIVAASTGALLVPYAPAGQARLTLLSCCYAMFGLVLIVSIILITIIWNRLAQHKLGEASLAPTFWIILGTLGQSITATGLLAEVAGEAMPAPDAQAASELALFYGTAVWGFALLWIAIVTMITIHAVRAGMPFALTWWSFTFPLGTVVTGSSLLADRTGADLFKATAAVLFAVLLAAWATVMLRTLSGTVRGQIFLTPAPAGSRRRRRAHLS
jgi:C4-dicarboxylate transporter/malic acid transport protein